MFRGYSFVAPQLLFTPNTAVSAPAQPGNHTSSLNHQSHMTAEPQCKFFQDYTLDTHELGNGAYRCMHFIWSLRITSPSTVHRCTRKTTGEECAVKIVSRIKSDPRREVDVLRKAQGELA